MEGPWRDLFLFLGLLVVLFILWATTGGPERAVTSPAFGPRAIDTSSRDGRAPSQTSIGSDVRAVARDVDDIEERLEEIRIEGVASPYRGLVSFAGGRPRADLSISEYVRIRASGRLDEAINVTGWRIESLITGNYGTIPSATPLPFAGVVNSTSPLFLEPGDTAIVSSGRSPLGVSFRINKCVGYLDQAGRFIPRLSRQCPDPDDEFEELSGILPRATDDRDYDDCERYIRSIDRCEIVREDLRVRHPRGSRSGVELPLPDQCATFIEDNLTYQGCVNNHLSDADFYRREWRVFMGSFSELWREDREVLRLLDRSGRVVDVWQY